MFIVESIAKIRRMYYVDGKGIKTIARDLNISKNTVKKIIRSDATKFELAKHTKTRPALGEHINTLNKLLKDNLAEPVRRRMTAKRIFDQLKITGYQGSYESVNLIVREFRREHEARGKQVFIPLVFEAGESFQFDWGLEEVLLKGVITRVKAARIKLCHSRYSLVIVYPNEQLEMVISAHDEAFKFFGGCCKNGIYDNMKTAVTKILIGKDRILNETFAQMASHYLFIPIACTPASGWEKGQVEKQVGDSRRNFFTPIIKGETFAEINAQLQTQSIDWASTHQHPEFHDKTILEVFQEERSTLIPYRGAFTQYKLHATNVAPTSTIMYDTNQYSVECAYVGLAVQIKSYAWQIEIIHNGKIIGSHERCFLRYQSIYNPWHYVPALERKPGALRNGAPFIELMSLLPVEFRKLREYLKRYNDCDKQFIAVLQLILKHDLSKVATACRQAIAVGGCNIKMVTKYLEDNIKPDIVKENIEPQFIQLKNPPNADCGMYNNLYLTPTGGMA